jgi:hypothetical protein
VEKYTTVKLEVVVVFFKMALQLVGACLVWPGEAEAANV